MYADRLRGSVHDGRGWRVEGWYSVGHQVRRRGVSGRSEVPVSRAGGGRLTRLRLR